MSTVLLLDFDGVILRNKQLSVYQSRRSAKFLQKHTSLPLSTCVKLNNTYYPKYGHTVLLVNDLFGKRTTLEEYNDYVFNKDHLQRLNRLVCEKSVEDIRGFENVFKSCARNNMDWAIFSNANINWVSHFSELGGLLDVTPSKIIYPTTLDMLKPEKKVYDYIESVYEQSTVVFVDDSTINLVEPEKRDRWIPVHFKKDNDHNSVLNVLEIMNRDIYS